MEERKLIVEGKYREWGRFGTGVGRERREDKRVNVDLHLEGVRRMVTFLEHGRSMWLGRFQGVYGSDFS